MRSAIVHPDHYQAANMEVLDVIDAFDLDFHRGNVIKYLIRAGRKGEGTELEDLQKARFYLDRYIRIRENKTTVDKIPQKKKEGYWVRWRSQSTQDIFTIKEVDQICAVETGEYVWRLPTVQELEEKYNNGPVDGVSLRYWTSTTNQDGNTLVYKPSSGKAFPELFKDARHYLWLVGKDILS